MKVPILHTRCQSQQSGQILIYKIFSQRSSQEHFNIFFSVMQNQHPKLLCQQEALSSISLTLVKCSGVNALLKISKKHFAFQTEVVLKYRIVLYGYSHITENIPQFFHFLLYSVIIVLIQIIPTNQENWPSVGTIASTLAQYSAIYGNTLGLFSWFVGML